MLNSVKIARRQSEIRQSLSALVAKTDATADELRSMETLDAEYRTNETRFRAALVAEDTERREAGADLETRSGNEWDALVGSFEMRQVALLLDEGRALSGRTAEVVAELRNRGGYRGTPVPLAALERRNTVASDTPNPLTTRPIIDRLFPDSVAARMGAQMISIDSGLTEWPVTTSAVTAGWQSTESGSVAGPTQYTTVDKALAPNNTLGIRMAISRKAMLQSGNALEEAVRRDMNGAMAQAMDRAVFLGTGADGQPLGVLTTPATYGITSTAVGAVATWSAFRAAVVRFMAANAANGPQDVRLMIRPEIYDVMDNQIASTAAPMWEWDRLMAALGAGNVTMTNNCLAAPTGTPLASTALMTTSAGGVSPIFVGVWGAVDLIRDPYSDAQSGGLRLTALTTMDLTVARGAQLQILTGLQQS